MSYVVKEEHDDHYIMQHPDGSHFKVAKKGLSKPLVEKIQKLAWGGLVKDPPKPATQPTVATNDPGAPDPQKAKDFMKGFGYSMGGKVKKYVDGGMVSKDDKTSTDPIPDDSDNHPIADLISKYNDATNTPQVAQSDTEKAYNGHIQDYLTKYGVDPQNPTAMPSLEDAQKYAENAMANQNNQVQNQAAQAQEQQAQQYQAQVADVQSRNQVRQQAGLPPLPIPEAPGAIAEAAASPSTPQIQGNIKPASTDMGQNLQQPQQPQGQGPLGFLAENEKAAEGALNKIAQAKGNIANEQAKAYQNYQQQQQSLINTTQKNLQSVIDENTALYKQVQQNPIDPQRYFKNMSTGNKVLTTIGLILGGLGAGSSHGQNMAVGTLNDLVQQDINSQIQNMDSKNNLIKFNLQKYGNINDAYKATSIQYSTMLQAQIEKAAQQNGTPMAQAQAQLAITQLRSQAMSQAFDLARNQAVYQLASGNTQGVNPEMLPPEARERTVQVPGPNGQPRLALASTKEDATKFKASEEETDILNQRIKEANDFISRKGFSPNPFGQDKQEANNIRDSLILSIGKLHDLNRINDNEFETYKHMVPSPGQWNSSQAQAALMTLHKFVNDKRNAAAKTYLEGGYNPGKFSSMEGAPNRQ